jgi:amino acid adenylation domain-containing protein
MAGRRHDDLQNIIGMFVNTLSMRNYPAGEKRFSEFLEEVKERTLEVYENQEYPFEELVNKVSVRRDTGRNPIFDVVFNFLSKFDVHEQENIKTIDPDDIADLGEFKAIFDITLQASELEGLLYLTVDYCTKIYRVETIKRFITFFKRIVVEINKNPTQRISSIDIISGEEKKQILVEFNDTAMEYPAKKTIHRLFEEQAEKTPDNIAAIGKKENARLTYNELNERSDQLSYILREKGVLADDIIGIMVERSIEMLIDILGILKAGGAYLPVDPEYPQERIDYMLKDSGAKLLMNTNNLEAPDFHLLPAASHRQPATSLAYVIYTSGSTGVPKGVMVDHGAVVNLLFAMQEAYPCRESHTWLLKTSYMFDVSVTELFGWFLGGGQLVVLQKGGEKDPYLLLDIIKEQKITHINFVPVMFTALVNILNAKNIGELSGLRYIFLAGEVLPAYPVNRLRQFTAYPQMENLYGPTEATVYASGYSLSVWDGSGSIPIGRPFGNVKLYIIGKRGLLQPVGVAGELCISGAGVARGYLNNPELTAEKFIEYRSYRTYGTYTFYNTGDLARWLPDGNIEFLGRIDFQVKIRGFRIELGEIENQLLKIEGISEAIVIDRKDTIDQGYLCAYIVSSLEINSQELKNALARVLPDYMIPSYVMQVDKIPFTPNGKVDRQALPLPGWETEDQTPKAPRNEIEEKMVEIWADVLGIKKELIGINRNFFELGGHSLKATIMTIKIHEAFNIRIPLEEIFKAPTVEGICSLISVAKWINEQDRDQERPPNNEDEEIIL